MPRSTLHSMYKILLARYKLEFLNLICKLWMTIAVPLLIVSHAVKGLGQFCTLNVGKIQATVFARSLSNLICKFLVMRGGGGKAVDLGYTAKINWDMVIYSDNGGGGVPLTDQTFHQF